MQLTRLTEAIKTNLSDSFSARRRARLRSQALHSWMTSASRAGSVWLPMYWARAASAAAGSASSSEKSTEPTMRQHGLEVFDTLEARQSLEEEREVSEGLHAI